MWSSMSKSAQKKAQQQREIEKYKLPGNRGKITFFFFFTKMKTLTPLFKTPEKVGNSSVAINAMRGRGDGIPKVEA